VSSHIFVLPGGGYGRLSPNEGPTIVAWLEGLGASASELRYPVSTRHPEPLLAIRREIRARREAGATRVAVLGFSAGGHAAGLAALAPGAAAEERVDAAVLCYPVVSMMLPTHGVSRQNLIGADAPAGLRASTSLDLLVAPAAPPFFLWHTTGDTVVPPQHSYLLAMALAAGGIPHELHVFPGGRHGLNLAREDPVAAVWTTLCADWLRRGGWLPG
jgi:acetyl esterase/lipase